MHNADVIIAGAGPAGSTAALTLARRGFSVTILDRTPFPRPKLCGGLLTWKSMRLLEHLDAGTADSLVRDGIVDTVTDGFALYHGGRLLTRGRLAYPFHLVHRPALDAHLLGLARSAGALSLHDHEIGHCSCKGVLSTSQGEFRGRYVVGADGVNSVTRRCFCLPRDGWRKNLAAAIEVTVPSRAIPRPPDLPELHAGILPTGYGWVFPNSRGTILGICGLRRRSENFRSAFKKFLRSLGISDPEGFLQEHPPEGHPIPYGNALDNPVHENILLAGDAGGYADPLLGEGIFYALLTGLYAGEALADALEKGENPGPIYSERVRRFIMPEMRGANRLRWLLYGLEKLGAHNLKRYFSLRGSALPEMVHGRRSYDWGKKKTWGF